MNEVNLQRQLRELEKIENECKIKAKSFDQQLIMFKIEIALLKCQHEEALMELYDLVAKSEQPDETNLI